MVVLAASIVTKSGQVLDSRQFVDMSHIQIEGLLAVFPNLVATGKQHTYVETENVCIHFQSTVSLPALREAPSVRQIDGEQRNYVLEWLMLLIDDSNCSGSMEFLVPPVGY